MYKGSIGFSANSNFYQNHPLSITPEINSIACLNSPVSNWSNVMYQISQGEETFVLLGQIVCSDCIIEFLSFVSVFLMLSVTVTVAVNGTVVNKMDILEGDNVILSATVNPPLTPHYSFLWSFRASGSNNDDAVIIDQSSSPHYSLMEDGLSLHVSDAAPTNRGSYTILVTNSLYTTSATVSLDVLCKYSCILICV